MTNATKIVLAVGVIVLAGVVYWMRSGTSNTLSSRMSHNAALRCRACSQTFTTELGVADLPPFVCEKCGKKDAWKLWKCNACGELFVPDPVGNPPRPPIIPSCPKCKSQSTGGAPAS